MEPEKEDNGNEESHDPQDMFDPDDLYDEGRLAAIESHGDPDYDEDR